MYEDEMMRLLKARTGLVIHSPFFGRLALELDLKVDPASKTAFWVDGKSIGVHPDAARDMPLDELQGMVARGTLHAAFGHTTRRGGRELKRWSEAAGHVANLEVVGAGMVLPPGSPMDRAYLGMTVEQVYQMLEPPEQEGQEPPQGQGQGQEPSQGQGQGQTPPSPGEPNQGVPSAPGEGSGEVRDAPGDAAEVEELSDKWQEATAQAAQLARGQGKLSGSLERAADQVVDARVSWREALQRYFKSRAKDDHSWLQPNRRYLGAGIILPGLQSVRMGPLVFAVDMSGSVKQENINRFFSEIENARVECNPECIIVLPFDTSVRAAMKFEGDDPIEVKAKAGGGTAFSPVVRYITENDIRPEVLVYLTDLECSDYAPEPEYPVLWVTVRKGNPPYGEVIEMLD
jgi:predicted metal-dependent peptidase